MITKIKMNNVASYKNLTLLETDKKVNLLYGLNGTGKSTLSNFLYNRLDNKFVDCSIEGLKESDTILVYNQQFIRDNFYETEDIPGIFTLSKENKEIKELIDKAKNEISIIEKNHEALDAEMKRVSSEYEENLEAWQEKIWAIKDEFTGKDSVLAYCLDGLKSSKSKLFTFLMDREKVSEEIDYEIESLIKEAEEITSGEGKVSSINKIGLIEDKLEKSELLKKVIVGNNNSTVAGVIEELKNSDWVNKGMEFIDTDEDPSLCPFCQQKTISKKFIEEIKKYFDRSYLEDKERVERLLKEYTNQTSLIVDEIKKIKENRFLNHNLSDIERYLVLFESEINSNINIMYKPCIWMFEEDTMFKFKKLTAIALVAVAAMGLLAGCGNDKPKMTQQEGVLRVGSETTFPPFEFTEGDKYVGFDVDLSEAISKKIGLKMEFKSMGFDALIPAVQSGDIDMIAAGINATPEREKVLDFSDVYFDQGGFITVVRKDNTTIHNMDELTGKTVGVQIGTIPVEMAQKIPNTTVKQIDSNANIFMELKAGTIDGAIIDNAVAMYYLKQGADQDLKLVGEPTKSPGTVLGVKKGNKELQAAVNKALKELKEDGTYQKIYDKWFGNYNQK